MTGRIDLLGVYLFLIIFYWTPPHFWALALLKQSDYGRAGVPMAPLVWGERETMRNMLWYTLILVPLTLLPVAFGALGVLYFVMAALLGAWLLIGVVRVMRAAEFAEAGVGAVQVLAAVPRAAVRGDGRRSGGGVTPHRQRAADAAGATAGELPVLLGASAGAPETLLLIGMPGGDGVVHVRVWSASDWSAPPRGRAERATRCCSGSRSRARRGAR